MSKLTSVEDVALFLASKYEEDPDYFAHAGVKGMKWGVRKNRFGKNSGKLKSRATMKGKIRDTVSSSNGLKSQSKLYQKKYNKVFRKAQGNIRSSIKQHNKKYKGVNFKTDRKARDDYYNSLSKSLTDALNNASAGGAGNLGQGMQLRFKFDPQNQIAPTVSIGSKTSKKANLSHADEEGENEFEELYLKLELDDDWHVLDIILPEDLAHDDLAGIEESENEFAQYGVKGMKWGVRKARPVSQRKPSQQKQSTSNSNQAQKTKSKPAQQQSASSRSVKVQKAKPTSMREMNNTDLRKTIERLRLEKEYTSLIADVKKQNRSKAQKFIDDTVKPMAGQIVKELVKEQIKNQIKGAKNQSGQKGGSGSSKLKKLEQEERILKAKLSEMQSEQLKPKPSLPKPNTTMPSHKKRSS